MRRSGKPVAATVARATGKPFPSSARRHDRCRHEGHENSFPEQASCRQQKKRMRLSFACRADPKHACLAIFSGTHAVPAGWRRVAAACRRLIRCLRRFLCCSDKNPAPVFPQQASVPHWTRKPWKLCLYLLRRATPDAAAAWGYDTALPGCRRHGCGGRA